MKQNSHMPCMSIFTGPAILLWCLSAYAGGTEMFVQGNDFLMQQNYTDALGSYQAFVEENSEHYLVPAAMWSMANIHFTINEDYQKAAELFDKVVAENPDTEWELFAYGRLAVCYEQQTQWHEAAETYESAITKYAGSNEDDIRIRVEQLRGNMITCYQNSDDHEGLIRAYKKVLEENPAAASAPQRQYELAQTYLEMEARNHAAKNFVAVVERYPASPFAQRVQSERGELLALEYNYDWTPFTAFSSAVEQSRAGQYDEARVQFNEVLEIKQNTDMVYAVNFQKELLEFRIDGDAAAFLDKLESTRGDYPYGYGGVSAEGMHAVLQRIVDAQEDAVSNPGDVGAYLRMGWSYYQTGAYESAIETAEQGIISVPDSPDLYNMLGYCYINLQRYDDAVSTFEQLVAVAPDDPNSYDSMAECYYTSGDTTRAIELYQQSLAVDSSFTNPYFMLGRIYSEIGETETAQEHLEHYLELEPEGFQAQNAQNLLNTLQEE